MYYVTEVSYNEGLIGSDANLTIWGIRCQLFAIWETEQGITKADKRAPYKGSRSSIKANSSASVSTDRWRSWTKQALDSGKQWLGFHIHINNLVWLLSSYSTLWEAGRVQDIDSVD